jgi:hypothetical protein
MAVSPDTRTLRTSPVIVLSVRPVAPHSEPGRTGLPPLGGSGCPVRLGNPIDCSPSIPCSLERVPLGDWLEAGSGERILSTDLIILNRTSPNDTDSTKTGKQSR